MKAIKGIITKEDGKRYSKTANLKVDSDSAIRSAKELLFKAWCESIEKELGFSYDISLRFSDIRKASELQKRYDLIMSTLEYKEIEL